MSWLPPICAPPSSRVWTAVPGGENWWPDALPASDLDYTLDVSAIVGAVGDTIATCALAIMPSGAGEMQMLRLGVDRFRIIAELTGGVPGRVYRVQITATGETGRVWQWIVGIRVSFGGSPFAIPPPAPNPGYGTEIMWPCGTTTFGPALTLPAVTVAATGTTQLTATPAPLAKLLVIGSPGLAISLPQAATFAGNTMPVFNRTGGTLLVFPYGGDTIENNGVNASVTLENEQTGYFSVSNSGLLIFS